MSYTSHLLRLENEREWATTSTNHHTPALFQPKDSAKAVVVNRAAALPSSDPHPPEQSYYKNSDWNSALKSYSSRIYADGLSNNNSTHSYYDCCINVHVSSLLDHWLDWDNCQAAATKSRRRTRCSCCNSSNINECVSRCRCPPAVSVESDSDSSSSFEDSSSSCSSSDNEEEYNVRYNVDESSIVLQTITHLGQAADPLDQLRNRLNSHGCDIATKVDSEGRSLLHNIAAGKIQSRMVECCQLLLSQGFDPSKKDVYGETALLSVRQLLNQERFNEAYALVCLMTDPELPYDVDVNATDNARHTLLAYSAGKGDAAEAITRHLLNSGANVWQDEATTTASARDLQHPCYNDDSAFKFFLKSLMQNHINIDNSRRTLEMLCTVMSEQPLRMGKHVDRSMMELGVAPRVNGPLFKRLRSIIAPFTSRPQSLKGKCLATIRRSVLRTRPLKRLNRGKGLPKLILSSSTAQKVYQLNLPQQLQRLVCLGEQGSKENPIN